MIAFSLLPTLFSMLVTLTCPQITRQCSLSQVVFFINCVTFKRTYKMSRLISFLLIIFFFSRSTYGMDCNFGNSKNIIDEIVGTCPRPLLDSADKSYCCIDIKNDKFYCCDAEEFALKTGLGIVVPAIIATVVILMLIISCISCLCCSCCPWYRRRHRGTVYGKVQTPGVVHVIQTLPNRGTTYVVQNTSTAYPTTTSEIPRQSSQHSQEAYAKQAPYNPHYV